MKRKSWWCLLLVGLVTVVGCAKNDVPSKEKPGLVYDAVAVSRILGLPCESNGPVPQAQDGEIVVYYGGWDLKALRTCAAGEKRMGQEWEGSRSYESQWQAEKGYYRFLLPVPGSNYKSWSEQLQHLKGIDHAWKPAPVFVAATALLVHLTETGNDLLKGEACCCAEPLPPDGLRVALSIRGDCLRIYSRWDADSHFGNIFLSAARKVP